MGCLLLFCGFIVGFLFKGFGFFMFKKDFSRAFLFCYSSLWILFKKNKSSLVWPEIGLSKSMVYDSCHTSKAHVEKHRDCREENKSEVNNSDWLLSHRLQRAKGCSHMKGCFFAEVVQGFGS